MDYRKSAADVLQQIGGKENLVSAAHCATRLRLVIADNSKCNKKTLEDVDGVKGVFEASGQLQIIFGTGVVNKVYDEFIALAGVQAQSKEDVKAAAAQKGNAIQRFVKTLGDIFVPIIPAIVASGFLMGIMDSLTFMINNGFLNISTEGTFYTLASLFANTAYTFLPILIGFSGAKVFGGNPFLGAVIGMIMVHPNLQNAWTTSAGIENYLDVFGLWQVPMVGYQGHVISVIIAVFVMSLIEKWLHKHVPAMFDLFITPLVSVFVTGFLTLTIIGPVFNVVETNIISGIQALISLPLGIGSLVMGALYAPTVVTGIHHMYTIIDLGQLQQLGVTHWLPLASAANIAQGAAALAVALKARDQKLKSMALPSALSAFMGITEPAIFGVNMRFFRPFICACIGGGCGAMFSSITDLGATGTGVTGIFGILLCLNAPVKYILMFVISAGVAFVLTWLFGYKNPKPAAANGAPAPEAEKVSVIVTEPATVYCPVEGNVISREDIPDATFAAGVLGDGVGIEPTEGIVTAPFDGQISTIAATRHAIGIASTDGIEMLIHVGIDTVKMDGKGFEPQVQEGDSVKAGQVLMTFSIDEIKKAGYSTTTAVLVCNSEDYENFKVEKTGAAKKLDKLMTCK